MYSCLLRTYKELKHADVEVLLSSYQVYCVPIRNWNLSLKRAFIRLETTRLLRTYKELKLQKHYHWFKTFNSLLRTYKELKL